MGEPMAGTVARQVRAWRRYPAYKPSGVEWLGDVPEGWGSKKIKYVSTINSDALGENTNSDYELKYVDISSVDPVKGIIQTEDFTFEKAPSRARRRVQNGDVIVSTVRTYLKAIAPIINPEPNLIVSTGFAVIRPHKKLHSHFASFAFTAPYFVENVVANSTGVSYPAINASEIGDMKVVIPPLREQHTIAAFLDRETARIDALIEKKERQIELLQEKRAAFISHAVTKGLDPSVLMKDSEIEWLGMVPQGWEVIRLAMAVQKITNGFVGPTRDILVEDGVRYLQSLHIKNGNILFNKPYFVTEEWSKQHAKSKLKEGDVLIVQTGDVGQCCTVTKEYENCNCHALIILRLNDGLGSGYYLSAFLRSYYGQNLLKSIQTGALHPHLETGKVRDVFILLPPIKEQEEIMKFIDKESEKIDRLNEKISESIYKLQEYRSAIISAAVTGKIDVRQEARV
jgi:type I restriction enzyme, S subunit